VQDLSIQRTPSAYDYQLTITNLFKNPVVNNPEQEIVYRDQKRYTYAEFRKRVCRLANMLTELGVKPGDTVAVIDYDSHRYLECYFAVPMIGAVLHSINIRLSPEQILYTIDHAEDNVILTHADFLPLLEQIRGRIDFVENYVLLSDDGAPAKLSVIPFAGEYEDLLGKQPETYDFPELDENTRATTFYTTGTTGMPKGVYFSHRQLVLHAMANTISFGTTGTHGNFTQQDVYMPITPMFHVHAWGFPYIATSLGVKQVYPGRYAPDLLLKLIIEERVTFSHCVPTILNMLTASPLFADADLTHWKVLVGGAKLPKAMCRDFLRKGIDIFAGYGMSETCPVLTVAHLSDAMMDAPEDAQIDVRCKTGRSNPLVDLRVVDKDMNDVPRDNTTSGEIVVRAPWLTQGYFKDSQNSENLWRNGYLHTGDIAVMDEAGYVQITDREKDVIKIAGEWLSSLEVEDIIIQHKKVSQAAVIGIPDEKWGERPLALVVAEPDTPEKDLARHLKAFAEKGLINRNSVLTKFKFVDSIAMTSVGKTDKKELRKIYAVPEAD